MDRKHIICRIPPGEKFYASSSLREIPQLMGPALSRMREEWLCTYVIMVCVCFAGESEFSSLYWWIWRFLQIRLRHGQLGRHQWRWIWWLGLSSFSIACAFCLMTLFPKVGPHTYPHKTLEWSQHTKPIKHVQLNLSPFIKISNVGTVYSLVRLGHRGTAQRYFCCAGTCAPGIVVVAFLYNKLRSSHPYKNFHFPHSTYLNVTFISGY